MCFTLAPLLVRRKPHRRRSGFVQLHSSDPHPRSAGQGSRARVFCQLWGFVTSSAGVERRVSVVHKAEEDKQGLFSLGEATGMVGVVGHLLLLREGRLRWPLSISYRI